MAIKSNRDTTALAGHYPPAARNHPLVNGVPMGVPGLGSLPPSRGIEDVNPDFFVDVNSQLIGRPSKRSKLLSEHGDDEFKHLVMALERTDKGFPLLKLVFPIPHYLQQLSKIWDAM